MPAKMRRNLAGTFVARDLGDGAWRLSRSEPEPIDIFVRGAEGGAAAEVFRPHSVADIGIEWHPEAVVVTMTSEDRRKSLNARQAVVHEPLAHLYDALPLAGFDRRARRFWRRVFRLVRIPGGRHLLGMLARRKRN